MPTLLDVTLDVCANEFVCLLGPRGCGKSTLLMAPQSDAAGTQLFVLTSRARVNAAKDLELLKISMAKGSSITMAIEAMCKATGVDFDKLQTIHLALPDQVTALAKGDIDAMAA